MAKTAYSQRLFDATDAGTLADELGQLAAEIKDLQDARKFIEGLLIAQHVESAEGDLYRVSISYDIQATKVDWKAVAAKLNPSRQLVTAHSKTTTGNRVNVRARKTSN